MSSSPFRSACATFLRFAVWASMIVFILVSSVYVYLDWRAEKRWAEVQAMLKREGETLLLTDLMPPRLPEAENYAAIPELRGINAVEDGDEKKGESGAKRQALINLMEGLEKKVTLRMHQGTLLARSPDWSEIAEKLTSAQYLADLPPPGKEAEFFGKALEARNPLLKQLVEAARRFQEAELVPALRDQKLPQHLMQLKVPHYNALQMTCRALALHGMISVETGDDAAALEDAKAMLLLIGALQREPLLIGHLVSLVACREYFEIIWGLLLRQRLPEAELADLQTQLTRFQPEQSYLLALRGELVVGLNALDAIASDSSGQALSALDGSAATKGSFRALMGRMVPDSFFTESKVAYVKLAVDHLIRPMKTGNSWAVLKHKEALTAALGSGGLYDSPFQNFYARLALPTSQGIARAVLQVETLRRQALLACALERFRIKQGLYPERLDELVPSFLASVPLDPADLSPLRYRRTEAGRYLIWSVGKDGDDDAGEVNPGPGDNPAAALSKPEYIGDWAWQYEPVEVRGCGPSQVLNGPPLPQKPDGQGLPKLPDLPSPPGEGR